MKHQYFGDISDYRKYCVLRNFVKVGGLSPLVCWLLTEDDERNDGNNNGYLQSPEVWKDHDPEIFDFLRKKVLEENLKHLSAIEESGLLSGVSFFSEVLQDDLESRLDYFKRLHSIVEPHDLVFLDPDNGIETKSIKKGKRNSSKYVFLDEVEALWNDGKSLLIYQHFPRVDRITYMTEQLNRLREIAPANKMYAVKTSYMAYFALATEESAEAIKQSLITTANQWGDHLEAYELDVENNTLSRIDKITQRRLL